jgi:hypothetical protein
MEKKGIDRRSFLKLTTIGLAGGYFGLKTASALAQQMGGAGGGGGMGGGGSGSGVIDPSREAPPCGRGTSLQSGISSPKK